MAQPIRTARRWIVALSCSALLVQGLPAAALAEGLTAAQAPAPVSAAPSARTVTVSKAAELPAQIPAGTTVVLAADIQLASDQTITELAGTLDGAGHTITLANKPLAANVTGTVRNLNVTGAQAIASAEDVGSIAVALSGTIEMCSSSAPVKLDGFMGEPGGLAGTLEGGTIRNSYYAGTIQPDFAAGGIAGEGRGGAIRHCLFTHGYSALAMGSLDTNDARKVSAEELADPSAVDTLNADKPETGYTWVPGANGPVLRDASKPAEVNKDALRAAIESAAAKQQADYTAETWQPFAAALEAARAVEADASATQPAVNEATRALTETMAALERPLPTRPLPVPEQGVTHIDSLKDLESIDPSNKEAFYVLDRDLTIDDAWFMPPTGAEFAGVFDGKGHTITFSPKAKLVSGQLFGGVARTGVIQNVAFAGPLTYESGNKLAMGPLGKTVRGAVINCLTRVQGDNIMGFGRTLDGGVVSNCVSLAQGGKVGGVLFAEYRAGSLVNTYWQEFLANPLELPASALNNSYALELVDMKSKAFADLLNLNRGCGAQWGLANDGMPVFGTSTAFKDDATQLEDDRYEVRFTDNKGNVAPVTDHALFLSPDAVGQHHRIGTLALADVPAGSTITWETADHNKGDIGTDEHGALYVYGNTSGVVRATERTAQGEVRTVATIVVKAKAKPFDDFQVWYQDARGTYADVTDGHADVAGSEVKNLQVRVHYTSDEPGVFTPIPYSRLAFTTTDHDTLFSNDFCSTFYFKKPGTATITVTPRDGSCERTHTITLTSSYVAATSISMGYNEDRQTVTIHGRNPLSARGAAFLTDHAHPIVTPDNASNRDAFSVTSSNPKVAAYTTSGEIGYTPLAAGTTTFTATLPHDLDAAGKPLSAQVTATYAYANPLARVTANTTEYTLKAGKTAKLDLAFEGKRDAEGYSITEPGLVWTFKTPEGKDATGIVGIERTANGAWKHKAGTPDDGLFLPTCDYRIVALAPGTVVATGTPFDTTGGAKPVTVTITVDGVAKKPNLVKLAEKGARSAAAHLDAVRPVGAYEYGWEWEIAAFAQAGRAIDPSMIETYLASLEANKSVWLATPTDTERVAIALAALDRDIASFNGCNVAAAIYNNKKLGATINEVAFALLALDAAQADVPAEAVWTRDRMVAELASYLTTAAASDELAYAGDIDMMAIAIRALAPYAVQPQAGRAIEAGLDALRAQINPATCDFGSAETDSQVLQALLALGKDPANPANGFANARFNLITALMGYEAEPHGFSHVAGTAADIMASTQAFQALTAYLHASGKQLSWKDGVSPAPGEQGDQQQDSFQPDGPQQGEDSQAEATGAGQDQAHQNQMPDQGTSAASSTTGAQKPNAGQSDAKAQDQSEPSEAAKDDGDTADKASDKRTHRASSRNVSEETGPEPRLIPFVGIGASLVLLAAAAVLFVRKQ